mmetsp:Transcript_19375/g.30293  ORF Transcript_19375/g.30293 Transcript_19375/m.30293 type:complete len:206 (+) Transcript_19375:2217-2834(+)
MFSSIVMSIIVYNEKNSPELMPYNYQMIEFFKEILDYQSFLIHNSETISIRKKKLNNLIKRVELNRLHYILKSYFRCRFWKIEKLFNLSKKEYHLFSRTSKQERIYFKNYCEISRNYLLSSLYLNIFPYSSENQGNLFFNLNLFETESMDKNNNKYVFFKINKITARHKKIKNKLDGKYFQPNSVYCMTYNSVKHLAASNSVLIL